MTDPARAQRLVVAAGTELVVAAAEFSTKACPAVITAAESDRFRPRIGRSRA